MTTFSDAFRSEVVCKARKELKPELHGKMAARIVSRTASRVAQAGVTMATKHNTSKPASMAQLKEKSVRNAEAALNAAVREGRLVPVQQNSAGSDEAGQARTVGESRLKNP